MEFYRVKEVGRASSGDVDAASPARAAELYCERRCSGEEYRHVEVIGHGVFSVREERRFVAARVTPAPARVAADDLAWDTCGDDCIAARRPDGSVLHVRSCARLWRVGVATDDHREVQWVPKAFGNARSAMKHAEGLT